MIDGVGTPFASVDYAAAANIAGLEIAGLPGERRLSNGTLKLRLDRQGMEAEGEIALDGVPLAATWREDFRRDSQITSQYLLSGRMARLPSGLRYWPRTASSARLRSRPT
jgi:hypothetical protein